MCKVVSLADYLQEKNRVIVKRIEQIPRREQITQIEISDNHGDPAVLVKAKGKDYLFPLTDGRELHMCNQMLRSLDLGIDVEFQTFMQYFLLIEQCNSLLHQRGKGVKQG